MKKMSVSALKKEWDDLDKKTESLSKTAKSLSSLIEQIKPIEARSNELTKELWTRKSYRDERAKQFIDSHKDVSSIRSAAGSYTGYQKYRTGYDQETGVLRLSTHYNISGLPSDYTLPKGVKARLSEVTRGNLAVNVDIGRDKNAAQRAHNTVVKIIADVIRRGWR